MRLNNKASALAVTKLKRDDEDSIPIPSPEKLGLSESNPFSVKSDEIQNTQRRSTSFLDSIEAKGLENEQKKSSMQKPASGKGAGLTLADFGTKITMHSKNLHSVNKNNLANLPTKKSKPKNKTKTGFSLWFDTQKDMAPKSGPLKWRRLPAEEKDKWLEAAKDLASKPVEPTVSLINSFQKLPVVGLATVDEKENSGAKDCEVDFASTPDSNSNNKHDENIIMPLTEKEITNENEITNEKEITNENNIPYVKEISNEEEISNEKEEKMVDVSSHEGKSDISNDKEHVRTSKRRASSESDSEKNPPKTKKLANPSEASSQTKSKLAAFQFKKK